MKKMKQLIAGITVSLVSLSGICAETSNDGILERIYPRFGNSWVGDTMPFFDGNEMQIFYLNDARFGSESFHPWYHASTRDFVSYEDHGEALSSVEDLQSQELALGTGSVIKVGDTYHAFYTGHNKHLNPHEAILHATSHDMKTWTKHPEHTFFAPAGYEKNDFRDPHVLYIPEDQKYWMLITARQNGKGVIAKLTSSDLIHWKDEGVLFKNDTKAPESNLECPTLLKYGKYWYLSFSDQWPDRVTQYRIGKSPSGPFKKPDSPAIDGNGFYAGKFARMNGGLYAAGWTPSKHLYKDNGDFTWAGNLVVHQLVQQSDGELYTTAPDSVLKSFPAAVAPEVVSTNNSSKDPLSFKKGDLQVTTLGKIRGITKITGEMETSGWRNNQFGLAFNVSRDRGRLNIVFDKSEDKIYFYNVPMDRVEEYGPQITISHDITDNTKFKVLIDDSVMVIYVDDQIALSTRAYRAQNRNWGVFSNGSNVKFSHLTVSAK